MDALTLTFTICAVLGGALFLVRLILQFIGGFGVAADEIPTGHHDVSGSDFSFKVLSFQGITAFLLMFGLAGRALLHGSALAPGISILGASIAGFGSVWLIAKLFRLAKGLQSSGTQSLGDAIGAEGTVYLNIPAGGIGQVQVYAHGRQLVHDAQAEDNGAIPTGTNIKVTALNGRTFVVKAT